MQASASSRQGFDLAQYDRFLYLLPHAPSDATTAGLSVGDVGWCTSIGSVELGCLFHELGHTIGFTHAGELLPDETPIGPGWVMGWANGFPKTVAPGETRSFPLIVGSPSSAAPGSYAFTVTVTEADGDAGPYSVQTSATYTVVTSPPDTTPPSTPTGLDGSSDGSSVSLTWNPSTDDSGVAGYQVLRESVTAVGDYTLLGTTTATSYDDLAVAQGVPHRYVVRAFDPASSL